MLRCLGQVLSIVAVLASAINTQCDVSCSLESVTRSAAHEISSVASPRTGHACCPEQKSSKPRDKNRQQQPCSNLLLTVSDVGIATALQHLAAPPSSALASGYYFDLLLPIQRSPLPVVVDSSGLHYVPAFSILRI